MGILPPPQKDGEIKFFIAKGLPYRLRIAFFALSLIAGFGLQLALGFVFGYPLLILGMLLAANAGYDSAPRPIGIEKWEKVSPDEYEKITLKAEQLKKWDDDFFDITSGTGLFCLFLTAAAAVIGYTYAAITLKLPEGYWIFFALDGAVLILPLWLIGTRSYLKKDRLVIKIGMLTRVMEMLKPDSGVQVEPMLALYATASGGTVPEDARLMIKLTGAPAAMYGVQVQLSINSVQGKDFPYLYCVLIVKRGSGLLKDWSNFKAPEEAGSLFGDILRALTKSPQGKLTYEYSAPGDVEIVVIRQHTTRQTGYFTPPAAALKIVTAAVEMARCLAATNVKRPAAGAVGR